MTIWEILNGKSSVTIKRNAKYTNPTSLQDIRPRKYASLKSKIDEQSILLLFPDAEHNFFIWILFLSICSMKRSVDADIPPKIPIRYR